MSAPARSLDGGTAVVPSAASAARAQDGAAIRFLAAHGAAIESLLLVGWVPLPAGADAWRWVGILVLGGLLHLRVAERSLRDGAAASPRALALVAGFALLFRLTLVPLAPTLSTDAYRHAWEGRVLLAGEDPQAKAPADPSLTRLRDDEVWPRVNHPERTTIYATTALVLSAAAAFVRPALDAVGLSPLLAWKLVLLAVEAAGAWLLLRGLGRAGRAGAFLVYAWAPIALVEFYGSGHLEAAGVGLVAGALGLSLLRRPLAAGVVFALAIFTKWIPAIAVGAGRRWTAWRPLLAGAAVASLLLAIPLARAGEGAVDSLRHFQANWEFGGLVHDALRVDAWAAIPRRLAEGNYRDLLDDGNPGEKGIGRALASAAAILVALRRRAPDGPAAFRNAIFALLLVQPTVHPWYATWLLPPLALAYRRSILAWAALLPVSYEALARASSSEGWTGARPAVSAVPLLAALLVEAHARIAARRNARGT